jgi:hypothetical protein
MYGTLMMTTTIHDHSLTRTRNGDLWYQKRSVSPTCRHWMLRYRVVVGGGRSVRYLHQLPSHQIKYHDDDPKK